MDGLEESIFQRNVPGKYSGWQREGPPERTEIDSDAAMEASDIVSMDDDAALMNCAAELARSEVPEPIRRRILAERARGPSTGVKGVLADYKASLALAQAEAQAEAIARQQIITRIVEGAKVKTIDTGAPDEDVAGEEDDSSLDDDGDDAFMREFRAKRMQKLRAQTGSMTGTGGSKGAAESTVRELPVFGTVREIRSEEFVSEVDGTDCRVTVVLHLYEPAVQGCVRMNTLLEEVAATMPGVKFLRMQASSNEIAVDRVALPILTLYRAGQEVDTLAGIAADFGQYFTLQDILWLLQTSIPPPSAFLPGAGAS